MSGPVDAKLDRRKRLRKRAIDSAWSPSPTLPPVQMLEQLFTATASSASHHNCPAPLLHSLLEVTILLRLGAL
jgi:hypothetical protein